MENPNPMEIDNIDHFLIQGSSAKSTTQFVDHIFEFNNFEFIQSLFPFFFVLFHRSHQ